METSAKDFQNYSDFICYTEFSNKTKGHFLSHQISNNLYVQKQTE